MDEKEVCHNCVEIGSDGAKRKVIFMRHTIILPTNTSSSFNINLFFRTSASDELWQWFENHTYIQG